jgi:hypothetical protein
VFFRFCPNVAPQGGRESLQTARACLTSTDPRLAKAFFKVKAVVIMGSTITPPNHPVATVCVINLPNETSEADIRELFAEYGSIQRVRLFCAEPDRMAQGHGYFELSAYEVEKAVACIDGHLFKGAIIRVSHVSHGPPTPEGAQESPAGAIGPSDGEVTSIRMNNEYAVTTVEKAISPEGGQGRDWFRYVLSSGRSQINGLHCGTLDEVMEYATSCAELVNSRSVSGKSARTYAPSKKK